MRRRREILWTGNPAHRDATIVRQPQLCSGDLAHLGARRLLNSSQVLEKKTALGAVAFLILNLGSYFVQRDIDMR